MEATNKTVLSIGSWRVSPQPGEISRNGETIKLEARAVRILMCLAEKPGEVVTTEELLNKVWPGVFVSQDSVYQAIAGLRRALGDDPKRPTYIETVPRLGYRLVAKIGPLTDGHAEIGGVDSKKEERKPQRLRLSLAVTAMVLIALAGAFVIRGKVAGRNSAASAAISTPEKSIAVLPFLDLTEGMKEEEFADGMTEELIDKLSKIPALRVPPPTSSFYFKNKQVPITEIAKSLGVVYVLDGSTRKSGNRLRVAARLVRADSAYVLWSETYDRPWEDSLKIQDEIAGEVTKALKASIAASPHEEN